LATFGVGVGAIVLLVVGERVLPRRPIALFVVAIAILVMTFFPLARYGIKTVGTIPEGLPLLGWPVVHWSEVDNLLVPALACFLLSYVESISVVRTFALKHRYPVSADQELLALGVANLAAGVGQGYPLAGGMSQSAVNEKAGARTPLALIFASVAIGVVLLFLTGLMRSLPEPVLAAVVLIAVGGLVRPRELLHLYRVSKLEFRVAMLATVGVLSFGILKGVLLAAIFSILMLLRGASHPRIALLGRLSGTDRFVDSSRYSEGEMLANTLVLRVESGLFYFNAQPVKNEILRHMHQRESVKLVVIDLSTSPNIDLAGVRMLGELEEQLTQLGVSLKLAEVHGAVRDLFQAERLHTRIGGIDQRLSISALIERWNGALSQAN
jgi:MFS superfamily sulfate permease-like transporter